MEKLAELSCCSNPGAGYPDFSPSVFPSFLALNAFVRKTADELQLNLFLNNKGMSQILPINVGFICVNLRACPPGTGAPFTAPVGPEGLWRQGRPRQRRPRVWALGTPGAVSSLHTAGLWLVPLPRQAPGPDPPASAVCQQETVCPRGLPPAQKPEGKVLFISEPGPSS